METHEYIADKMTIVWKPKVYIHAAVCVKMLPKVYNPNDRPWIKTQNATVEELKDQIEKCPSGALSYQFNS